MNISQSVQLSWLRDMNGRFSGGGGGGRLGNCCTGDAEVVVVMGTFGVGAWGVASQRALASGPPSKAATASRIRPR